MNVRAITFLLCLGVAAPALAQDKGGQPGSASKATLSEVRTRVHDLEGDTSKLRDLMSQYATLVERRPGGGSSPEAKKAEDKWKRAVDRLMQRLRKAHASVLESTQRLDQVAKRELPTSLAKDVANARNDAESTRGAAESALAKHKPKAPSKSKEAKAAKRPPAREGPDSDPLRGLDM